MSLEDLNKDLMECKGESLAIRGQILYNIHCEKARLIRDKSNVEGYNVIEEGKVPSYISTDYRHIEGMSAAVTKIANKYSTDETQDALESEGYVGLTLAMQTYDEEKDASWSTYAYNGIEKAILKYLRKQTRWDKMEYRDDLEEMVLDEGSLNPEEELLKKEQVEWARSKVQKIQRQLNERELYVLWHTILSDEPETYREIGEQFNCSKDAVLRDMNRLKAMLKEDN